MAKTIPKREESDANRMALNPLHQFEIKEYGSVNVGGLDIAFTNQSLWMLVAIGVMMAVFSLASRKREMVPGRLQSFAELTYEFVQGLVKDTAGHEALRYLPYLLTLFLFIACLNLFGMIPGSYTATSQIYMTGFMAVIVFLLVIGLGLVHHGLKFFSLFLPKGTPLAMAPLIVVLELISFFARPFTLAIRLAANMIAGHVLLKIFASFAVMLSGWFVVSSFLLPLPVLIALTGLEIFVALLQAYIFTILTCVYLHDSLHLH